MSQTTREGKTFTFSWTIRNIDRFFNEKYILSPCFRLNPVARNKWYLSFRTENAGGNIEMNLWHVCDNAEHQRGTFECKIMLLNSNESKILLCRELKSFSDEKFSIELFRKPTFVHYRNEICSNNTLKLLCEIWNCGEEFEASNQCHGQTTLTYEYSSFAWPVYRFSSLEPGQNRTLFINLDLHSSPTVILNIMWMEVTDDVHIEITRSNTKKDFVTCWIISVTDIHGNVFRAKHISWNMSERERGISVPSFFNRTELMANKSLYLPNDTLNLRFNYKNTQTSEILFNLQGQNGLEGDPNYDEGSSSALSTDFANLYNEGLFSDLTLQVESETFSVHRNVLSARSPVFRTMLTIDMKERNQKCIELKDIQPDVLRRLLFYIYTDTVEDMSYGTATALYSAADKYDLKDLRRKCADVLKSSLSLSNALELLVLADMHSDGDLRNRINSFFFTTKFETFCSPDWENFAKQYPTLALSTMKSIILTYKRNI